MESNTFKLDLLKHDFEPITNYPELEFNFPMIEGWYIKVVVYSASDSGELTYWYKALSTHVGLDGDDRIKIISGSLDFRNPLTYDAQSKYRTEYMGLVSSNEFFESLMKHLLGTTDNSSVENYGTERYNERLGEKMRKEFPQYYSK